jgi:hypothetical protein
LSQPAVHFCTVAVAEAVTAERSNATTSKNILFIRGSSFRETPTCNPFAVKDYVTLYEPFLLIFFFPYATIMPYGD